VERIPLLLLTFSTCCVNVSVWPIASLGFDGKFLLHRRVLKEKGGKEKKIKKQTKKVSIIWRNSSEQSAASFCVCVLSLCLVSGFLRDILATLCATAEKLGERRSKEDSPCRHTPPPPHFEKKSLSTLMVGTKD
jgi:hypothetical protein